MTIDLDAIQARADAAIENEMDSFTTEQVRDMRGYVAEAIGWRLRRDGFLTPARVLKGDWKTVRDALDALPDGAQIRWRLQRYGVEFTTDADSVSPAPHGSVNRYKKHGCRCETCRCGNATRKRLSNEQRSRKRRQGLAEFAHGYSGYTNWGCRCWKCTDANAQRSRRSRERVTA